MLRKITANIHTHIHTYTLVLCKSAITVCMSLRCVVNFAPKTISFSLSYGRWQLSLNLDIKEGFDFPQDFLFFLLFIYFNPVFSHGCWRVSALSRFSRTYVQQKANDDGCSNKTRAAHVIFDRIGSTWVTFKYFGSIYSF